MTAPVLPGSTADRVRPGLTVWKVAPDYEAGDVEQLPPGGIVLDVTLRPADDAGGLEVLYARCIYPGVKGYPGVLRTTFVAVGDVHDCGRGREGGCPSCPFLETATVRYVITMLWRIVGEGKGPIGPDDMRRIDDAVTLLGAL